MAIPAIIHRIWLGSPIPEECAHTWRLWRQTFPEYKLLTWTERELAEFDGRRDLQAGRTFAERSDIARLRILNRYGGIYVDCDTEPLRRFDHLWTSDDRIVVFEEAAGHVCNGLIAAAPGSLGFIEAFTVHNARRQPPSSAPTVRTGPYAFSAALDYECSRNSEGIRIYDSRFLDFDGTNPDAVVDSASAVAKTRFPTPPRWAEASPSSAWYRRDLLFEAQLLVLRARRRLHLA